MHGVNVAVAVFAEWQSWEWYSLCKIAYVTPHVGDPGADASRVVVSVLGFGVQGTGGLRAGVQGTDGLVSSRQPATSEQPSFSSTTMTGLRNHACNTCSLAHETAWRACTRHTVPKSPSRH
jgi:hypothetical protein